MHYSTFSFGRPLGSPMPALSKNMKVLFLYTGFEPYGFFNSDYKCCFTSHCSFATLSLIASPHKKCITALFLSAVRWDHQYKQQAAKSLLFLLFSSLSANSNVMFLKKRILGIYSNCYDFLSKNIDNYILCVTTKSNIKLSSFIINITKD